MTRTPRFTLSALTMAVALFSHAAFSQSDVPVDQQSLNEFEALTDATGEPQALPSLPGLFVRALDHDSDLSRQQFELEATREEIPMARSRLLPQVTATGGYLWQDSTNLQTVDDAQINPTPR